MQIENVHNKRWMENDVSVAVDAKSVPTCSKGN